uniref:F-box/LRR-repeat protein 15/At3g58940/PEG3-like LRR domain-containing protein n=1 Tax=Arundo donax TaxID=35708 RepID=A0A0A9A661_ARUDO
MANGNAGPFVHIDAATEADARHGPATAGAVHEGRPRLRLHLPSRPARLRRRPPLRPRPASAACGDADGRISSLLFTLLRSIVSRLPAKDAMLSRRWRPVWRCTPLVFTDAHLLPGFLDGHVQPARAGTPGLVSRVLAAHPGPFRHLHAHPPLPWRLEVSEHVLPPASRRCGVPAPHLRELVLCSLDMENRGLDFLLAASPILETLGILGSREKGMRLRLVGRRLRFVQISMSYVESIAVVDTPNLERLFLWGFMTQKGSCTGFKIGHAPKLRQLGFLEPRIHMLEIGNTVINPLTNSGIRASPSTMAPSVKILGLHVRFVVAHLSQMLSQCRDTPYYVWRNR